MKHAKDSEHLPTDSASFAAAYSDKDIVRLARPLIQLIYEACDEAASGHATWISIGTTKTKTAFVITVHQLTGSLSVFGDSPEMVVSNVPDLL